MISLIHPSRGRPEKSLDTILDWHFNSARKSHEIIISVDEDQKDVYTNNVYPPTCKVIFNKNRSAVAAINNAAKIAKNDIFIVVSDDTECPKHWDLIIYNETIGKTDYILKTQDGIQDWIITMPVMDRAYYNRFGYIYHPDYQHMFCDTELSCVADLTGRRITSNLLFKHNHYSVTGEKPDAINKKADATWAQGEAIFKARYSRNFDLKPEDIKGKIKDTGMINWLMKK